MSEPDDQQEDQNHTLTRYKPTKNRKVDAFSAFGEWLRMQEDMNPKTIATYVSCMRKISTIVPDFNLDTIATFTSNQKSKSVWRSAYRRFVVYMEIAHEVQMEQLKIYPMGRPTIVKRTLISVEENDDGMSEHSDQDEDCVIPDEVLDALVTLLEDGAKPEELSKLYWCHIMETGKLQHVEAPHPALPNTWLVLSRKAISTLKEWAKPSTKGMSPLVPKAPGSKISYNWSILRGVLAVRKRTRQEFVSS